MSKARRLNLRYVVVLAAICTVLGFQNCAQAPDSTSDPTTYEDGLPFAYDAKLDTMAYMSCNAGGVPARAYFTFRAGAYKYLAQGQMQNSGLGLTPEFVQATRFYSTEERGRLFSTSFRNSNTYLNFSVRDRSNLQAAWEGGNGSANGWVLGNQVDTFLPTLDSPEIAGPLASLTYTPPVPDVPRLNYFPGSDSQRLMEASLRLFTGGQTLINTVQFGGNGLLVAGYSESADQLDKLLRSPFGVGARDRVYGSGYQFGFNVPPGFSTSFRPVLTGVQEIDLKTNGLVSQSWRCYPFKVVRPEDVDAGRVVCRGTPDTATTEELVAIRRVLRVEDWYVDLNNRCVKPKTAGDYCYGALGTANVMYAPVAGVNCDSATNVRCPHYVTVCIRP